MDVMHELSQYWVYVGLSVFGAVIFVMVVIFAISWFLRLTGYNEPDWLDPAVGVALKAVAYLFAGFALVNSVAFAAFVAFLILAVAFLVLLHIPGWLTQLGIRQDVPFYLAAFVGFGLLVASVKYENKIIGGLGAALVVAGFSHWVGPIQLPK